MLVFHRFISRFSRFLLPMLAFLVHPTTGLPAVTASQPVVQLPTVTVTAPAWKPPCELVGDAVSRAGAEDIGRFLPTTGPEALGGGVLVTPPQGGPGRLASPMLGGFTGARVLVLRDGMPVNDPFTGNPDLGDIDPGLLDSVEVYRGSGASWWGSNAIGGVLHLRTAIPATSSIRLFSDGVGGNGRELNAALALGDATLGVSGMTFRTQGWSAADGRQGNAETDPFEQERLQIGIQSRSTNGTAVRFLLGWRSSDTALDTFSPITSAPVDDPDFIQHRSESTMNLHIARPLPDGEWQYTAGRRDAVLAGDDPTDPWNGYDMHSLTHQQAIDRFWYLSRGEIDLGVSHQETDASNDGILERNEADDALRGGVSWSPAAGWKLRSIGRIDRYTNPGDTAATGKLALSREQGKRSLEAAWGTSFRRPSLNERFYPNYGDEHLAPETGRTLSLALTQRAGTDGIIEVRSYRTRADNLIGTVATTDPAYAWGIKAANLETAEITGHELDVRMSSGRCRMEFEYSRTPRARILSSGCTLPRVPGHAGALTLRHPAGNGEVFARYARWGASWDDAGNTRSVSPTDRTDIGYLSRFHGGTFRLALLNIANTRSQRIYGYGEPGRRLAVSWEMDL